MKDFAKNVVHFNVELLKITNREKKPLEVDELVWMTNALREEISEFENAHIDQDYLGAIDALLDLMYFAVGGLHKLGLSVDEMERCALAVHECNMLKRQGVKLSRGTGCPDATKPEGWISPEQKIAEIIGG
jgi:predicted HAD superfamily Cof-like phosphohydrolase